MKTQIIKAFIITAAAAAMFLSGCKKANNQGGLPSVMSEVKYVHPERKPVEMWDTYTARIDAVASVELRSRVSGYLQKINFKEGEIVKKGELLFVIDPRPYEAALAAAKAGVKEIEAKLILANSNLSRAKELYAANALSKEVLETRSSEMLSAEAALLNAQAKLREAELNVEYSYIRAPMTGRISEFLVDPGNLVSANVTLLTTIVKSDVVQAYFEISERDYIDYVNAGLFKEIDVVKKTGPEVFLSTLSGDTKPFKGTLNYYDNRIGLSTSSLTMRADFDNADGKLSPGMFGNIKLMGGEPQQKIVIAEDIIGTDLVNRYVIVLDKDNVAQYRPLKVGRIVGKYRVIEQGLDVSDRVVSKGLQRAIPGRKMIPSLDVPAEQNASAKNSATTPAPKSAGK